MQELIKELLSFEKTNNDNFISFTPTRIIKIYKNTPVETKSKQLNNILAFMKFNTYKDSGCVIQLAEFFTDVMFKKYTSEFKQNVYIGITALISQDFLYDSTQKIDSFVNIRNPQRIVANNLFFTAAMANIISFRATENFLEKKFTESIWIKEEERWKQSNANDSYMFSDKRDHIKIERDILNDADVNELIWTSNEIAINQKTISASKVQNKMASDLIELNIKSIVDGLGNRQPNEGLIPLKNETQKPYFTDNLEFPPLSVEISDDLQLLNSDMYSLIDAVYSQIPTNNKNLKIKIFDMPEYEPYKGKITDCGGYVTFDYLGSGECIFKSIVHQLDWLQPDFFQNETNNYTQLFGEKTPQTMREKVLFLQLIILYKHIDLWNKLKLGNTSLTEFDYASQIVDRKLTEDEQKLYDNFGSKFVLPDVFDKWTKKNELGEEHKHHVPIHKIARRLLGYYMINRKLLVQKIAALWSDNGMSLVEKETNFNKIVIELTQVVVPTNNEVLIIIINTLIEENPNESNEITSAATNIKNANNNNNMVDLVIHAVDYYQKYFMRYINYFYRYVDVREMPFIAHAFGINIQVIINNKENEKLLFEHKKKTFSSNNTLLVMIQYKDDHYTSVVLADEMKTFPTPTDPKNMTLNIIMRRYKYKSMALNNTQKTTDISEYMAGTFYYMQYDELRMLFFSVFYSLLKASNSKYCLFSQIVYVHSMISSFYKKYTGRHAGDDNMSGRLLTEKEYKTEQILLQKKYHVLHLPITLGFGRIVQVKQALSSENLKAYAYMLIDNRPNVGYTDLEFKAIQDLIQNTGLRVLNAMQVAANICTLFMCTPSETAPKSETYTGVESQYNESKIIRLCMWQPANAATQRNFIVDDRNVDHFLSLFTLKCMMRSPAPSAETRAGVTKNVCQGVLKWPDYFQYTAFFEFFSSCLTVTVFGTFKQESAVISMNITPTSAPENLPVGQTDALFQMPTDNNDKKLTIMIDVAEVFSGLDNKKIGDIISDGAAEIIVWFTSTDPIKALDVSTYIDKSKPDQNSDDETFDAYTSEVLGMKHFRDGSKTAFAIINIDNQNFMSQAAVEMIFESVDLAALANSPHAIFIHFALMVREKRTGDRMFPRMVRRGHSFIDIKKINTDSQFTVRLWEGPIDSQLTMCKSRVFEGQFQLEKTFSYEATFDLKVRLIDPMKIFQNTDKVNMSGIFNETEPNQMFTQTEMLAVANYLYTINKKYSSGDFVKHSLMYMNMPMSRNVIPLLSVALLPPLNVSACVLESRIDLILFQENISAREFLQIAYVALANETKGVVNLKDAIAWGFAPGHFDGYEYFSKFAQMRFWWIFTQIVNPYSKMRYAFDTIDDKSTEQMGMPGEDIGDCEDFAEAAMRFCKGLTELDSSTYYKTRPEAYIILSVLAEYVPCMAVMTTAGAAIKTTTQKTTAQNLHMVSVLVSPFYLYTAFTGNKLHNLPTLIPLEGTGPQFNVYTTPDYAFAPTNDHEVAEKVEKLKASVQHYNWVVEVAYTGSEDVKNETIIFPMMINREGIRSHSPGSGYKADSFINPSHYFYGDFISLCHDRSNFQKVGGFLDFFRTDTNTLGVPFYMAVQSSDKWELRSIIVKDNNAKMLYSIAERFARNVMPASALYLPTKHITCKMPPVQPSADISYIDAMCVKAINFYLNAKSKIKGKEIMQRFKDFLMTHAQGTLKGSSIHGVSTVFTLNLNTNYHIVQVTF